MRIANRVAALSLWLTILATTEVDAATIILETGLVGPNLKGVNGGIDLSWSSSIFYTNVDLIAAIFSGSAPRSHMFFLTTHIGLREGTKA